MKIPLHVLFEVVLLLLRRLGCCLVVGNDVHLVRPLRHFHFQFTKILQVRIEEVEMKGERLACDGDAEMRMLFVATEKKIDLRLWRESFLRFVWFRRIFSEHMEFRLLSRPLPGPGGVYIAM